MTPADRALRERLREVASKATPGPWRECGADRGGCQCGLIWQPKEDWVIATSLVRDDDLPLPSKETVIANAALIVAAVNALPSLLTHVES